MKHIFLNSEHKNRLKSMLKSDNTNLGDTERLSLFYIISGNNDLYGKRRFIYNPNVHSIFPDFEKTDVDFSEGIKSLIRLGFNLYNGWSDNYTTPLGLLGGLDENNLKLANYALTIRFNYNGLKELQKELLV